MRGATLSTLTELKRKITKNSVHHEDLDYAVDPITGWRFYKRPRGNLQTTSSGSRANLQLRHRRQSGTKLIVRRAKALTIGEFFSELGQVSVAWRKTSSQPTGGVNSTPTNTARTELHSMITFHHANTRGSRAGRLRIAHLCVLRIIVIHMSCFIPLPHLTLTTSASSLSPIPSTSPFFPTVSPSHTSPMTKFAAQCTLLCRYFLKKLFLLLKLLKLFEIGTNTKHM